MPLEDIPSTILPELFKRSTTVLNAYVFSIDALDDYKYVSNNADIFYGGKYTALAIKRSPIKSEEGTILQELEIGIDNVDLNFRTMVMDGKFDNKLCKIYSLFLNSNNDVLGRVLRMQGYMDAPKGDQHWLTVTIRPFPLLEREFPRRIFQLQCNWTFCDTYCDLDLNDYMYSFTLSEAFSGILLNVAHGKDVNYFVPGYMQIMDGYYKNTARPILENDSTSVILRIPFDATIPSGTSVRLQKLCSKNEIDCKNIFNNFDHFGGFPFCPTNPII